MSSLGNSKQKWVPLNIEPPRPPPPRGSYYRNREGRDNWNSSNGRRDYDKERKDTRNGGRFDRGGIRDRSHRPWRFDRDNGYTKYREKEQYSRDHHDKNDSGSYKHSSGNGNHWNGNGTVNGTEDIGWQYNGGGMSHVFLFPW